MDLDVYQSQAQALLDQIQPSQTSRPYLVKNYMMIIRLLSSTQKLLVQSNAQEIAAKLPTHLQEELSLAKGKLSNKEQERKRTESQYQSLENIKEELQKELHGLAQQKEKLEKIQEIIVELKEQKAWYNKHKPQNLEKEKRKLENILADPERKEIQWTEGISHLYEKLSPRLHKIQSELVEKLKQREEQHNTLVQEIGTNKEKRSRYLREIESKQVKKDKIERENQILKEKVQQIQKEANEIEKTYRENVKAFERHFKHNEKLWEIFRVEEYTEQSLRNYVDQDLAKSITKNLVEFDDILKKTLAKIKQVPLA